MSKPVLGLIGAIGAGKSAAAACCATRGGRVVDADRVGHDVLHLASVKTKLAERWPNVLDGNGNVSRRAVADVVFRDPAERTFLESVVFPEIQGICRVLILKAKRAVAAKFVVLDAAVLLEAGWEKIPDKLLYIDAPRPVRLQRLAARGWTAADLDAREAAQWPADQKKDKAHAVIDNTGTLSDLQTSIDTMLTQWGWL